jgi:uncharacterized LabA/DUF88 family protein
MREICRIGLYVDADNIFSGARRAHGVTTRLNYGALLEYARSLGDVLEATVYTSRPSSDNRPKGFELSLKSLGFQVVAVSRRRLSNGQEKSPADVALALDVGIALGTRKVDSVLLVSGDGDFTPICEMARALRIPVEVVAWPNSTAPELIVLATRFRKPGDVKGLVERRIEKAA